MKILSNKKYRYFVDSIRNQTIAIAKLHAKIEDNEDLSFDLTMRNVNLSDRIAELQIALIKNSDQNKTIQTNPVVNQDLQDWLLSQKFNSTSSDQPERFFEFPFNV